MHGLLSKRSTTSILNSLDLPLCKVTIQLYISDTGIEWMGASLKRWEFQLHEVSSAGWREILEFATWEWGLQIKILKIL